MEEHQEVTTTEARSGATPRVTRYVLTYGLMLIILAFIILYFVYG